MKRRTREWIVVGLAAVVAVGYAVIQPSYRRSVDPLGIPGAEEIAAPADAESTYQALDRCAGLTARVPFKGIRWVVADSVPGRYAQVDEPQDGAWVREHRTILLRRDVFYVPWRRSRAVPHDLMHARLPYGGHETRYFSERCGTAYP